MKNILVIIGSAGNESANRQLVEYIIQQHSAGFEFIIQDDLKKLPAFDPQLSVENPPDEIINRRNQIAAADGILLCTPEYIFSIPSGLKNLFEWCVATTVFSDKPAGLITASAKGESGHKELMLIMKTLMADFSDATSLLIQGVRGKIDQAGNITDSKTEADLKRFISSFEQHVITKTGLPNID